MPVKFTSHRPEVESALNSQIEAALTECGLNAQNYAQDYILTQHAVDTGRLLGSIDFDVQMNGESSKMVVGTNVEYATYVEIGTYKMKSRPYVKPSIANHMSNHMSVIQKHLQI